MPEGWQIISSLYPVTLSPGEARAIPLTLSVPFTALADRSYQIGLSATSQKDPQVKDSDECNIRVLPRAKVKVIAPSPKGKARAGQTITYDFTIMNFGNGMDRFEITATSAHGEKIELSSKIIELGIGESAEVKATIHIPPGASEGTRHVLTLKAASILLEEGVSDKAMVYTPLLGKKKVKEESVYNTLPSEIIFHLSGLGTGKKLGQQGEFYTHGYLDEKHWLNFSYQGPRFKDKENYKGLSEENLSFEFGADTWDVGLGDTTASLSDLTASSLSEQGVRFRVNKDPISLTLFNMEKKDISFKEELSGARIATKFGDGNEIGINYFQTDEEKTDANASRAPEEKKIASISSVHQLKDLLIRSEYAGSRFDEGSGEKEDEAFWIDARLKKEKFYSSGEYIYAGSDFAGRRKDKKGYRSYLSYNFLKPLWTWFSRSESTNNIKNDPSKATDDVVTNEIGASFLSKNLPFFSLVYQLDMTKSEQDTLLADSRGDAVVFRTQETFGRYSLSFDYKWGRDEDDIKDVDTTSSDYDVRVYGRWNKFSGWLGYGYNLENDNILSTETAMTRKEFGLTLRPVPNLYASMNLSQEETSGQNKNDMVSMVMSYEPWEDTHISLEGEYRDDHAEFIKEWQFWLSVRKRFDLPVPVAKVRSRVEGYIFNDENNNGVADKGEKGVSKVTLKLDQKKAKTNRSGRFKFPPVTPGEYELKMDVSSLPFGMTPRIELPRELSVAKGESEDVEIPLVRVCRISGIVFDDKNKNGEMDEDENGLALVRIIIIKDAEIYKDTFSDADGRYSFTSIIPDKYKIGIDKRWLPKRYEFTTLAAHEFDLAPGDEIKGLDFGSVEKEKEIVKTYTAQEVKKLEPVYVEKKKVYPRWLAFLIFILLMAVSTLILVRIARKK